MTLEQLVLLIVVGGIAGLLADAIVSGIKVGLVGAVIVGIIGAFIGSWLFGLLKFNFGAGLLGDIFEAFIGAVILLILLRVIRRQ
jgi:uncharacterized membrane protein YeaQ/YmgE (transglycosylase-associated protein family)